MATPTRRDFLQQSGMGLTSVALLGNTAHEHEAEETQKTGLPPHRPVDVPGVHAYPAAHSVHAGDTLRLHVSASVPYELAICRLGPQFDDPRAEEVQVEFPAQSAAPHPIYPGSYIHVARSLQQAVSAVSLEVWLRPWRISGVQAIVSQYDFPHRCSLALTINDKGQLSFYLGDGEKYRAEWEHTTDEKTLGIPGPKGALDLRWSHLVAVWDGRCKRVYVNGQQVGEWKAQQPLHWAAVPLRWGAMGEEGKATRFLDADIALPVIYARALTDQEIRQRLADKGLTPPRGDDLLGCWPLAEERGDRVADVSVHQRHGRIINGGTWMIGGPSFDPHVPRFGHYDPEKDPKRGHGLRLASDDLYDCRWPVRHEWKIPDDARPGLYVARFRFEYGKAERYQYVTFIVKRSKRQAAAPLLVLAATNTWRAYSSTPFAIPPAQRKQVWGTSGITNGPTNPPAYSFYRPHAAGQGTYQIGLHMPWPAASPYVLYGGPTDYSHLARAERPLHVWLERQGYLYDLISDFDLHQQPEILRNYKAFIIVGHNEYWSIPMYEGLQAYLKQGGQVINLSGNTLFWRVSFDTEGTVMECRKVDAPGDQMPPQRRGEAWHSQDARRGGLMRECGYPGWQLLGLETLGWNNQGNPKNFGPFIVENPNHPFFRQPEDLRLRKGERIGEAGPGQTPAANGHEFDVRLSTLARLQQQTPPAGAHLPNDPPGIQLLANGVIPWKEGGAAFDYFMRPVKPATDQGAEMIYWERPDGGRVFNAGTIGFVWAMLVDPRLQGLLRNVLAHFGIKPQR
ncbi:MAG: LamG domain-containing protein [Gemmataceae bacterium]|nr:LamG domain-containing protein [Gemmataceae bacterium]